MGYSMTQDADTRLNLIMKHNKSKSSNVWIDDKGREHFYEIGRENPDGAITASVMTIIQQGEWKGRCKRGGSIRIEPDGKVSRFPNMNADMKKAAKAKLPDRIVPMFQVI